MHQRDLKRSNASLGASQSEIYPNVINDRFIYIARVNGDSPLIGNQTAADKTPSRSCDSRRRADARIRNRVRSQRINYSATAIAPRVLDIRRSARVRFLSVARDGFRLTRFRLTYTARNCTYVGCRCRETRACTCTRAARRDCDMQLGSAVSFHAKSNRRRRFRDDIRHPIALHARGCTG